jgi:hypothetical protein
MSIQTKTVKVINVKKSPYNAVGDGVHDDTQAIQRALDAAHALGGGEVYLPAGVYRVSIQQGSVSDGGWVRALTIYANITLRGASRDTTTIRLDDNQSFRIGTVSHRGYGCILGARPFTADCSGFVLKNLCVDNNGPGNTYDTLADLDPPNGPEHWVHQRARASLYLYAARDGVRLESCLFQNTRGTWGVFLCGGGIPYSIRNAVVINNRWEKNGGGLLDHDSSTLYVAVEGATLSGNTFVSVQGKTPGTLGQRTAIEVHGRDIRVENNRIYGFVGGINVGGSGSYPHEKLIVVQNTIENAFSGIILWAATVEDKSEVVLDTITILKNTITLNINGWQKLKDCKNNYSSGVSIAQEGELDRGVGTLTITQNRITFLHYQGIERTEGDKYSSGIHYNRAFKSSKQNKTAALHIERNTITNAPGMGIYINAPLLGGEIIDNTIRHCGISPAPIWEGFRTGIFLVGNAKEQVLLKNNHITDTRTPIEYAGGTSGT